jgi:hypothetical protein
MSCGSCVSRLPLTSKTLSLSASRSTSSGSDPVRPTPAACSVSSLVSAVSVPGGMRAAAATPARGERLHRSKFSPRGVSWTCISGCKRNLYSSTHAPDTSSDVSVAAQHISAPGGTCAMPTHPDRLSCSKQGIAPGWGGSGQLARGRRARLRQRRDVAADRWLGGRCGM